jgi:hypothetical protein
LAARFGRDPDPRRDRASQVVALRRDGVEGRAGPKVHDAGRPAIERLHRSRVDDSVGADGFRIFVPDAHSRAHAGIHHERFPAQVLLTGGRESAGERRHNGCQRDAVDVAGAETLMLEEAENLEPIFVRHPFVGCRQSPRRGHLLTPIQAQGYVRVADVDRQKHRSSFPAAPWTERSAMTGSGSRPPVNCRRSQCCR